MYCSNCGAPVKEGQESCHQCGAIFLTDSMSAGNDSAIRQTSESMAPQSTSFSMSESGMDTATSTHWPNDSVSQESASQAPIFPQMSVNAPLPSKKNSTGVIVTAVLGVIVAIIAIGVTVWLILQRGQKQEIPSSSMSQTTQSSSREKEVSDQEERDQAVADFQNLYNSEDYETLAEQFNQGHNYDIPWTEFVVSYYLDEDLVEDAAEALKEDGEYTDDEGNVVFKLVSVGDGYIVTSVPVEMTLTTDSDITFSHLDIEDDTTFSLWKDEKRTIQINYSSAEDGIEAQTKAGLQYDLYNLNDFDSSNIQNNKVTISYKTSKIHLKVKLDEELAKYVKPEDVQLNVGGKMQDKAKLDWPDLEVPADYSLDIEVTITVNGHMYYTSLDTIDTSVDQGDVSRTIQLDTEDMDDLKEHVKS